jgi:membrane protein DedA with SNARE-associated domain
MDQPIPSKLSSDLDELVSSLESGAQQVVGRFLGPLRASVPLVAGILAMPYGPFQLANFASAFVWAGVPLTMGNVGSRLLSHLHWP